jgi:SAM-dependent methyltransferase
VTFSWLGEELSYADYAYNHTRQNERAVELAIAKVFVERRGHGRGLEVGNVLGHYGISGHEVIDLYETGAGVRNIDIFDVSGQWDWIVSVSTVEHIHWDAPPRHPGAAERAIAHMRSLLAPRGSLLVTVPLGWHPYLDNALYVHRIDPDDSCCIYAQDEGDWTPTTDYLSAWRPYDWAIPSARAVWVGTWVA